MPDDQTILHVKMYHVAAYLFINAFLSLYILFKMY